MENTFFKGNLVIFYLNNPSENFAGGVVILNPVIEESFGRRLIVGTVPSHNKDWASGLRTAVFFDQIAHFVEFKDENEFIERSALSENGGINLA
ncbi:MAG: hypothetical protein FP812_15350 [Desulfobacula sp.]|nr:hypothetical protein [Desulfobacula sp.]